MIADTSVSVDRVLAAAHDFSERRAEVFPAVSVPRLTVHELGATDADVTEGTRAGLVDELGALPLRVVTAWQRVATVTDSNIWAIPGSSWEITAVPENEGSRVGMRRLWLS